MSRCGIDLTSNDPVLLSFLVKYPANSSWTVIEVKGTHYLISPNFQGLATPQAVWQAADNLLFVLNGIMKLKFKSASLVRGTTVAYFDENDQLISATVSRIVPASVSLSAGEIYFQNADAQQPSILDIWRKAQNNDIIEETLQHYSNEHNWFNLYKVFETIRRDTYRLQDQGLLSKDTFDTWTKGRKLDFDESANRERHSSFVYNPKQGVKIAYMSLSEADEFISELFSLWLQSK